MITRGTLGGYSNCRSHAFSPREDFNSLIVAVILLILRKQLKVVELRVGVIARTP